MGSLLCIILLDAKFIFTDADPRESSVATLRSAPPEMLAGARHMEGEGDGYITSSGPWAVLISPIVGSQT